MSLAPFTVAPFTEQTDAKSPDRGGDAARGLIENRKLQLTYFATLLRVSEQLNVVFPDILRRLIGNGSRCNTPKASV
ncbi:MAG: hypothetical protein JZU52_04235 [Lamprocystis purpurea]|nr:hypothetical protein [Lamprocystis purpurea]